MEFFECTNCKAVYDQKKPRCPECGNMDFITIQASRGVEIKESEKEGFGKFIDCLLKITNEK